MKTSTARSLTDLAVFTALPSKDQRLLLTNSREITVPAGHELIRQGSPAVECMIMLEGSAQVVVGGTVVGTVGPGGLMGELALLDHGPRSATVTALEESRVLVLGAHEFSLALQQSPQFARRVLREVSVRLREIDRRVAAD